MNINPGEWVLETIKRGYRIEFTSEPPAWPLRRTTPTPRQVDRRKALEEGIKGLLLNKATRVVLPEEGQILYQSVFFLAPKKPNSWRPILNLKPINKTFVRLKSFRMETLQTILPAIEEGMWATTMDLKDTYFHIPIHPDHSRFLSFRYQGVDYQFTALPFGLSTVPRVFTRVSRAVVAFLRRRGLEVFAYIDDWLILDTSEAAVATSTSITLKLLKELGWIVNQAKSNLVPTQDLVYLGAAIDLQRGLIRPSAQRILTLKEVVRVFLRRSSQPASLWMKVLGYLSSLTGIVPLCRLRMRPLQWRLLQFFKPAVDPLTLMIPLDDETRSCLSWWTCSDNLEKGYPWQDNRHPRSVTTDASTSGWGAVSDTHTLSGIWDSNEKSSHINVLELLAILKAIRTWTVHLRGHRVTVFTDNTTAAAFINREGGTKSRVLMDLAYDLLTHCQKEDMSLRATFLAGEKNEVADALSRNWQVTGEWKLSPRWARVIFKMFDCPWVDLFATNGERTTSSVLHQESSSGGVENRRSGFSMGQSSSLRLPTLEYDFQSPEEAEGIDELRPSSSSSMLAKPAMVPLNLRRAGRQAIPVSTQGRPSNKGQGQTEVQGPTEPSPSCLAVIQQRHEDCGLSSNAASLAAGARRSSTLRTYDSRVARYREWAVSKALDPMATTVAEVCDFLTCIFEEGKQARTVANYRAALASVHKDFQDGSNVSSNQNIKELLKGMFNKRPPFRRLSPSWSIDEVLITLTKDPFEPMDNITLEALTHKTLFLVAAASARRRSTLHALTVKQDFLRFDGRGVTLLPDPAFLAKNQSSSFTPEEIFLPDLKRTSTIFEDKFLCPVRALRWYLKRTEVIRGSETRLFLLPRGPHTAASKDTLSRWIKNLIAPHVTDSQGPRAHDVRGHATSKAWFSKVPLEDILSAAAWKTPSSFVSCYLTDTVTPRGRFARAVLGVRQGTPSLPPR